MLAIITGPLIVQVQSKVCHLLLISLKGKGGAGLPNDHRELVAILRVGAAAVALLVEVPKGQTQPVEQA